MYLFFFNDTATTEIYTLSLHDALPIYAFASVISNNLNIVMKFLASITIVMSIPNIFSGFFGMNVGGIPFSNNVYGFSDRKSTRLNSSHANISYAVFCLKKKTYEC